jgi:hypothetical protein
LTRCCASVAANVLSPTSPTVNKGRVITDVIRTGILS